MIRFAASVMARIHAHVEEGYPHEVVGVMGGDRETGDVTDIVALINERADSPKNRYEVSGLTLMKAERGLEARGLEIVGYYHSHPDHPSQYSDFDREQALPNMSYPIVSVREGKVADLRCWRLKDDRSAMDPEEFLTLSEKES